MIQIGDLSDIIEVVDRSVFHLIRQALVDLGYLPDVKNLTTYPETPEGFKQYEEDLAAIRLSKGFAVEVFGTGTNQSRYIKKTPRIVINSERDLPGNLGSQPEAFYEKAEGDTYYTAKVLPPRTTDYRIEIGMISAKVKEERFLRSLIAHILPDRMYMPFYNDPTQQFLALRTGSRHFSNYSMGISEWYLTYDMIDLFQSKPVLKSPVAPLTEITVEVNTNSGNTLEDTLDITVE